MSWNGDESIRLRIDEQGTLKRIVEMKVSALGSGATGLRGRARSVEVKFRGKSTGTTDAIVRILAPSIEERCWAVLSSRDGDMELGLSIRTGVGDEGFRIAGDSDGRVEITGNDARGLLYGVGTNGFLRIAEAVERLAREEFAHVRT